MVLKIQEKEVVGLYISAATLDAGMKIWFLLNGFVKKDFGVLLQFVRNVSLDKC